jgi:hypothetical protein
MNAEANEPAASLPFCPFCRGDGNIRGEATGIAWFKCGYCYGAGRISEARFHAWRERAGQSPDTTVPEQPEPVIPPRSHFWTHSSGAPMKL